MFPLCEVVVVWDQIAPLRHVKLAPTRHRLRVGAVVLGADGVGKPILARLAAEQFIGRHPSTVIR
ncbi:hypothetical protein DIJ64_05630 [Mycobacterium leprae]|uniref:Uncharacterized protein n=1 Tax=Mycobacterium leprae TaxID=1769 RepID=A0AAD0KVZ8_MYCLR|nr:hypothetical protein [Mycobacterium leprae]AWV47741.1 hypothetical protein DIJ64_05630 [Mycobacterium leprae]OAR20277.1 hypothetical protein A8144_11740 [Mycobacterium leprae 3125609]OAX70585.1 hypothetical protein A3216_11070 [Mycobacterium leprae 7935681]